MSDDINTGNITLDLTGYAWDGVKTSPSPEVLEAQETAERAAAEAERAELAAMEKAVRWHDRQEQSVQEPVAPGLDEEADFLVREPEPVYGFTATELAEDPTIAIGMTALRDRLLTRDQLRELPPPQWLVEDLFTVNTLAWIAGEPGTYKSFLATELACSVATGTPFFGYPVVSPGPVLYLVAEGASGFKFRVEAWEIARAQEAQALITFPGHVVTGLYGEGRSPQVTPQWRQFVALCRELAPRMIVLDTQARITPTLDENHSRDMGVLVEALEILRAATDACIVTVHHTGKGGKTLRGSGALQGAGETIFLLEKNPHDKNPTLPPCITITNIRQKDSREAPIIYAHPIEVGSSVVLVNEPPEWKRTLRKQLAAPAEDLVTDEVDPDTGNVIAVLDTGAETRKRVRILAEFFDPGDRFTVEDAARVLELSTKNVGHRFLTPAFNAQLLGREHAGGRGRSFRYWLVEPSESPQPEEPADPEMDL